MPPSASFHFFFPFHFKKKYHTNLSLNPYSYPSLFYTFSSSIFIQPTMQIGDYIRNLALVIKYNKILEDFKDVQNSLKMRDIA